MGSQIFGIFVDKKILVSRVGRLAVEKWFLLLF